MATQSTHISSATSRSGILLVKQLPSPCSCLLKYADQRCVPELTDIVSEKALAGRARKAARAQQKEAEEAAALEAEEEAKWQQGAKGKTATDERRERRERRLKKKKELAQITSQDEKDTLEPTKTFGPFGPRYHSFASSCVPRDVKDQLEIHAVTLRALTFHEAVVNLKSLPEHIWTTLTWPLKFECALEKAYKSFVEEEMEGLERQYSKLSPWKQDRILWRMFEKADCNPANTGLPSATASKEEKLQMIENMKRSASYRTIYPGMRISKPYRAWGWGWWGYDYRNLL